MSDDDGVAPSAIKPHNSQQLTLTYLIVRGRYPYRIYGFISHIL